MDDSETSNDHDQATGDAPPPDRLSPEFHPDNSERAHKDHQPPERNHEDWPNRMMAICTGLLVVITGFYTCAARQQVIETRNAVTQGQQGIVEARRSADATEKAANAAIKQTELLAEQVRTANAQLMAASAQLVVENVRLIDPLPLVVGHRIWMQFQIRNVGETAARNIRIPRIVHIGANPIAPPDPDTLGGSVSVLPPSGIIPSPDAPSVWLERKAGRLWTADDARRTRLDTNGQSKERLYLQVMVFYTTIFGQSRRTLFCGYVENAAITVCSNQSDIE